MIYCPLLQRSIARPRHRLGGSSFLRSALISARYCQLRSGAWACPPRPEERSVPLPCAAGVQRSRDIVGLQRKTGAFAEPLRVSVSQVKAAVADDRSASRTVGN